MAFPFGAEWGNGESMQGQSYAIPTMEGEHNTLLAIRRFTQYAKEHPELKFMVTPIGCGIAGYTPEDIAPMLSEATSLPNAAYQFLESAFAKITMMFEDRIHSSKEYTHAQKHNFRKRKNNKSLFKFSSIRIL